jgi:hypothetical protein
MSADQRLPFSAVEEPPQLQLEAEVTSDGEISVPENSAEPSKSRTTHGLKSHFSGL